MLQHPTLDQLRHLKLHGMARAFAELNDNPQAGELDHGQWLALLLDREEAERDDRRLTYRLRNARLRHPEACIEDVDYRASRRLDKALFQQLARGKWIAGKQNLIVTGPCGVGKSWLACALGQKACRDDFSVLYKRVPRMFAELETGRADGRYPRLFRALTKANLLILDDWEPDRLSADQRRDLMEIVKDRYQNAAILITSQLPVDKWHDVIGDRLHLSQGHRLGLVLPVDHPGRLFPLHHCLEALHQHDGGRCDGNTEVGARSLRLQSRQCRPQAEAAQRQRLVLYLRRSG